MTEHTACTEWKSNGGDAGGLRRCDRPLSTPQQVEAGMCGPHLAGQRRRIAIDAKQREVRASKRAETARAGALAHALREALGIEGGIDPDRDGGVWIGPAVVQAVVALAGKVSE